MVERYLFLKKILHRAKIVLGIVGERIFLASNHQKYYFQKILIGWIFIALYILKLFSINLFVCEIPPEGFLFFTFQLLCA